MRQLSQLLAPVAASVADATLWTSPAATVTVIRMINVCNTVGAAGTFSLAIGGTTATAANCIYNTFPIAAFSTVQVYGPYVLPASTQVHGSASATTITFEASGELSVAGG